jgi:excisionase family DNA binding protein
VSAVEEAEKIVPITVAARALGVPYSALRRLVVAGRVPSVRLGGVRRVRLSQLRTMLEEIPPAA